MEYIGERSQSSVGQGDGDLGGPVVDADVGGGSCGGVGRVGGSCSSREEGRSRSSSRSSSTGVC